MQGQNDIIPRPPVVRERLAQSLREARLLRRLLRLSVEAAEERHREVLVPRNRQAEGVNRA
jgi:hypothetical protein